MFYGIGSGKLNIDKYVGIPHYFGESSFAKCDCIGLCRLFYREHGWMHIEDGGEEPNQDNFSDLKYWRRLYAFCVNNMNKVDYDNLQYGDFVIFKVEGDLHTGIYLEYGKLLSMQIPTVYGKTTSTVYHRRWWTPFFKYAFRRRKV